MSGNNNDIEQLESPSLNEGQGSSSAVESPHTESPHTSVVERLNAKIQNLERKVSNLTTDNFVKDGIIKSKDELIEKMKRDSQPQPGEPDDIPMSSLNADGSTAFNQDLEANFSNNDNIGKPHQRWYPFSEKINQALSIFFGLMSVVGVILSGIQFRASCNVCKELLDEFAALKNYAKEIIDILKEQDNV